MNLNKSTERAEDADVSIKCELEIINAREREEGKPPEVFRGFRLGTPSTGKLMIPTNPHQVSSA